MPNETENLIKHRRIKMSVNTKGFVMTEIKNPFTIATTICEALEEHYKEVSGLNGFWLYRTNESGEQEFSTPQVRLHTHCEMLSVQFKFKGEDRNLFIHFDCDSDGEDCGYKDGSKLILSLGARGSSIEIMEAVLKELKVYGPAYLIDNDCTDYELVEV